MCPKDSQTKSLSKQERDQFRKRLNELGTKMGKVQTASVPNDVQSKRSDTMRGNAMGMAMRIGIEFVIAVLIGGGIGWYLDQWLGTLPLFLLVFLLFGFAAGIKNVIRTAGQFQADPKDRGRDIDFEDD